MSRYNQTATAYPAQSLIHELFEQQVAQRPEAVAVVDQEWQLTYGELNRRANQLARYLRKRHVQNEAPVGLCLGRSSRVVIAALGILKAGASYAPLDPSYPRERLAFLLRDTAVSVALSEEGSLNALPDFGGEVVSLDVDWKKVDDEDDTNLELRGDPDQLCYLMYTSGSTGGPKGVAIAHRGVVRLVKGTNYVKLDEATVILQMAPLSFDASTFELWGSLLNGGRLVVMESGQPQLDRISEALRLWGVNTLWLTAGLFHMMVEYEEEALRELAQLLAGGDTLSAAAAERLLNKGGSLRLINGYGPTESTTFACCHQLDAGWKGEKVPIGRPIANTQAYILGPELETMPTGVAGEIFIGGAGLARGYWNQPEMTAERFVPNPYGEAGSRLYRSGDLGRYLVDETIAFLGRRDHQVKVSGFRVELGEIETALREHPLVGDAVVIATQKETDNKGLVAYVTPRAGQELEREEVRAYLEERLPKYMAPSLIVTLQELPLGVNGKVDRKALSLHEPSCLIGETRFTPPQGELEEKLAAIWSEVLGLDRVGRHNNFFEMGGDSILSIQIAARAKEVGLRISPQQIFQYQTVAELSAVVNTKSEVESEQGVITGPFRLTPIQLWFFEQNLSHPDHWNQSLMLETKAGVNGRVWRRAVQALYDHHDALRLMAWRNGNEFQAAINGLNEAHFVEVDLSEVEAPVQKRFIEQTAEQLQQSVRINDQGMMRTAFIECGPSRRGRLLLIIHHLVVDAVSWRILLEDIETASRQARRGQQIQLPAKTTSFKEWSERLAKYAQSARLEEASRYLAGLSVEQTGRLPIDGCADDNTEGSVRNVEMSLTEEETQCLLQQAYHTQINEVLLAALIETLGGASEQRAVLVDVEGHGREELMGGVDLTRTVGWFTAIYPIIVMPAFREDPGEILTQVKEALRSAPHRGVGYRLLSYLSPEAGQREMSKKLSAEVSFNYLGQLDKTLRNESWLRPAKESTGSDRDPLARRRYLLEVTAAVGRKKRLVINWTYSERAHTRERIEQMAKRYLKRLREVIEFCRSVDTRGYTPSDFPLANLDGESLNAVLQEVKF